MHPVYIENKPNNGWLHFLIAMAANEAVFIERFSATIEVVDWSLSSFTMRTFSFVFPSLSCFHEVFHRRKTHSMNTMCHFCILNVQVVTYICKEIRGSFFSLLSWCTTHIQFLEALADSEVAITLDPSSILGYLYKGYIMKNLWKVR